MTKMTPLKQQVPLLFQTLFSTILISLNALSNKHPAKVKDQ